MILFVFYAVLAGVLVSLSRQLNGRLALSTTPLIASFWNHLVGFALLTVLGLVIGGLITEGAMQTPWWAFLGGPVGVIFVASGSWLIARIGAINTALLVIGGQMVFGVIFDLLRGAPVTLWASALGVVLILGGVALTQRPR
ncbi:DMT family transporter [Devosia sp. SL43]|uniref:DMT family transporter n=1 Tax=Devosia sp. SL43 TaxID=2806348 RepID=UPI001F379B4E|nr:DMT family transporter [Devosia sp. SL43]UJW86921.1 DMT family transporter [Devosia sp. SL43]